MGLNKLNPKAILWGSIPKEHPEGAPRRSTPEEHPEEAFQETLLVKKNGQLVTATRSLNAQTNWFGAWGQRLAPVLLFKYLKNSLSG
jgi:hypothetical protein